MHQRDWDCNYGMKINSNQMDSPGFVGQASPDLSMFPVQFSCPEQGFLPLWWFGDAGPHYLLQVEYLLGASGDWEWGEKQEWEEMRISEAVTHWRRRCLTLKVLTFQWAFLSSGLMIATQSFLQPPFCWVPSKHLPVPSSAVPNPLCLSLIT